MDKDKLTSECSTGAVSFSQTVGIEWWSTETFLKTDESLDDYAKFQHSVQDILSSLVLSATSENEVYDEDCLIAELEKLQNHYFTTYARSCGLVQHGSNVDQVIRDGVLDWQSFFPFRYDVRNHLYYYIMELDQMHRVHKFFAYRKCLAKYDFIKWDSNPSEIFQRLELEKKWPELSNATLERGLDQHLSLLHELNRNLGMTGLASVCKITQGNRLLEAINKEYANQLGDVIREFEKLWRSNYFDLIQFKNLLHKRADQAQGLRTLRIPQDCHLTTKLTYQSPTHQKLFQLKDRALAAESWILENFTRLKARAGGKYYEGPLARSLHGFLLFAASLTVGFGMQKASR